MSSTNKLSLDIAKRLQEVLLDGKWIANTNYKEQLLNTNWQQAIHKFNQLNSIGQLTFHINYYIAGILDAYEKGQLTIKDQYSFDMPALKSEADWNNLVSKFISDAELLIQRIQKMEDVQLVATFFDKKFGSTHRNLEGIIEHSYYHLGQISLIKKIIQSES